MVDFGGYGIPITSNNMQPLLDSRRSPAGISMAREEFENLLGSQGTWTMYIRGDRNFPCTTCRPDAVTPGKEGDGNCPECLGLGCATSIERAQVIIAKGRRMIPKDTDTVAGQFGATKDRMYFPLDMRPQENDFVVEVEWNTDTPSKFSGEPIRIIHVYSIEFLETMHFDTAPAFHMSTLDTYDHHIYSLMEAISKRTQE